MKWKSNLLIIVCVLSSVFCDAQLGDTKTRFTHEDTLRGSLNKHRDWWDVLRYDLSVVPDIDKKTISGSVAITFSPLRNNERLLQIDLQEPLMIDSVYMSGKRLTFNRQSINTWLITTTELRSWKAPPDDPQTPPAEVLTIYYHGTPREAKKAPWDGGVVWKKDANGNPFIATAVEGLGASAWWPCKDHLSDEPDSGMSVSITAPDTLSAISNGRLKAVSASISGNKIWTWEVKNPINNYDVTMNIGKYVNFTDTLMGEAGKLDLSYWVMDYNLEKAKTQFAQAKPMLHCFEHWFGKYPFYEDGYKLVETPFLGMEHQSAVAYGNGYQNGYRGSDLSGTGWGLKWDFIVVHESGHEWFGNNITAKDLADMWIHESFTNFSETLFIEWMFGKDAGTEYSYGLRKKIGNDIPIVGIYGVNKEGSGGDMYYKGSNMLQTIRNAINDDKKFRSILRGLNQAFYHQTVTANQIEQYISNESGINFSKTVDQYLRTVQVPELQYYLSKNKQQVFYRWANCIDGFDMPIVLKRENRTIAITPTTAWKNTSFKRGDETLWLATFIESKYYINVKQVEAKP